MNNLVGFLAFVPFISLTFFSCGGNEEPMEFSVSTNSLQFGPGEETETLAISSNQSWTIDSDVTWIKVTPMAGSGNAQISITADLNPLAEIRSDKLKIRRGTVITPVRVIQEAKVPVFPDYYIAADDTEMRDISSLDLASEMGVGWNLGNSLEAIGGETAWGNPKTTKVLIDEVKAAGFNSVRIPVAWSKFSDASDFTIDPVWMARVQEVVDYVIDNDMYALINIHWDEGWMQPTFVQQDYVNDRLEKMWIQIALNFRDYEDHLLFAGTNEVMVDGEYSAPKPEYTEVQNSFNQTFVYAVRSTGGRNTYRNLVVQTFNTNIDYGVNSFLMPTDVTEGRLMVEAHYYDPYEFALQENENITQWGKNATDPSKTATWGGESHADWQFQKMKAKFIDNGVPVLIGEYGAIMKKADENQIYLAYYLNYVTKSMERHGLVPFYWDNGYEGDYGFALFDRVNGEQIYPDLIKAIID